MHKSMSVDSLRKKENINNNLSKSCLWLRRIPASVRYQSTRLPLGQGLKSVNHTSFSACADAFPPDREVPGSMHDGICDQLPLEHAEKKHLITDYARPTFLVPDTRLDFEIFDDHTVVTADFTITPVDPDNLTDLVLNGDSSVELVRVTCDGNDVPFAFVEALGEKDALITADALRSIVPALRRFTLRVVCTIHPETNTELQGLYLSNHTYCTQCESHGFRRIVYSFDRPDVLSRYHVTITADKNKCPVILSNGNQTTAYEAAGERRHFVVWDDPHPKPSYLFALVAGDLGHIESKYHVNADAVRGEVAVRIYAPHGKLGQLDHAMHSILKAMKWDEDRYRIFAARSRFRWALSSVCAVVSCRGVLSRSIWQGFVDFGAHASARARGFVRFVGFRAWSLPFIRSSRSGLCLPSRYGLYYDLRLFNIVCLDDFNMGAMENKGLNIFNSK